MRRWWAPTLAVVAVLAVVGAVLLVRQSARPTGMRASARPSGATSPVPAQPVTNSQLNAWLAAAPVVPGSVLVAAAPVPALERPAMQPASNHLLQQTRFWTTPGTVADVLAYVQAHLPAGWTVEGSGPQSRMIRPIPAATERYSDGTVLYTVAQDGDRTAVRVDAQLIWLPPRPSPVRNGNDTSVSAVRNDPGVLPVVRHLLPGQPDTPAR